MSGTICESCDLTIYNFMNLQIRPLSSETLEEYLDLGAWLVMDCPFSSVWTKIVTDSIVSPRHEIFWKHKLRRVGSP